MSAQIALAKTDAAASTWYQGVSETDFRMSSIIIARVANALYHSVKITQANKVSTMLNKKEMLTSLRVKSVYNKMMRAGWGTHMTMCRGLAASEEAFFFATADNKYWSDFCHGWVANSKENVCPSCKALSVEPTAIKPLLISQTEHIDLDEFGDSNCIPGQRPIKGRSQRPKIQGVRAGVKHGRKVRKVYTENTERGTSQKQSKKVKKK